MSVEAYQSRSRATLDPAWLTTDASVFITTLPDSTSAAPDGHSPAALIAVDWPYHRIARPNQQPPIATTHSNHP